ncbi:MAG: class I SAM-dependent methyltransferase family protein [Thaumarchaeota archaeon]|nr:class I SAM-dependent methyltransferase family protein [Nitrososphaerota archaeon]
MARMLKEALRGVLERDELSFLASGFDTIGDIAILRLDKRLEPRKSLIASVILGKNKAIKTILNQVSPVSGEYRVRSFEYVAGEEKTLTTHRENGCVFVVDVDKVYFSPRLSTERLRVANMVESGETVVNMFAGVGVFSVTIAKKHRDVKVFSIDVNPVAHEMQVKNIQLNKVEGRVIPLLGDARNVINQSFRGVADRVIMPLPENAHSYLPDAVSALKEAGGMIHYYTHVFTGRGEKPVLKAVEGLNSFLKAPYSVRSARVVREVGPGWVEVSLDLKIGGGV